MNGAHVHLLVNHLPIVGAMLALPVLLVAAVLRSQPGLMIAGAILLTLGALGAGGALWSGEGAEEVVEHLPDVHKADIEAHEERADVATALAVLAALASLGAAGFELKRSAPVPRGVLLGVLALALANAGAMAWTGAAGGLIRHTEIRDGAVAGVQANGAEPSRSGRSEHEDRD